MFRVSADDISVDVKNEIPTEAQIGLNVDTFIKHINFAIIVLVHFKTNCSEKVRTYKCETQQVHFDLTHRSRTEHFSF